MGNNWGIYVKMFWLQWLEFFINTTVHVKLNCNWFSNHSGGCVAQGRVGYHQPHRKPFSHSAPGPTTSRTHKLLGTLCLQPQFRLCLCVQSVPLKKGRGCLLFFSPQATSHMGAAQRVRPEVIHCFTQPTKQEHLMAQMCSTAYFVFNDFIWKTEHSSKEEIEISK